MTVMEKVVSLHARDLFSAWLVTFGSALENGSVDRIVEHFAEECYWKDYLAFTWEHRNFAGHDDISRAFQASIGVTAPRNVRIAADRMAPRLLRRSGRKLLEGFFDFDTEVGVATGFVRLLHNDLQPAQPQIWQFLTALQHLHGCEARVGARRPSGNEYAMNTTPNNWSDDRAQRCAYADRNPEVLIVGGGHAGLILAARLGQMNVDTLVVDKLPRLGDVWRNRYHSLTLHNESTANHLPYMPFPETWPIWLSKDRLAGWLESYAEFQELNVWTATELQSATYDETSQNWTVTLRTPNEVRTLQCKHLVIATGVSGSIPNKPKMDGLDDFKGEIRHSGEYTRGGAYRGKKAIVVGTGNSGHDIAQDLSTNGAENVWLYQRSPTCVVSLEPSATSVFQIYREGPVEDIDLTTSAIPYPVLEDTYKFMTKRSAEKDAKLLADLNEAGFQTYFGHDDTGFHMMYLRGEGGYYINVGCSDLIIERKVGVLNARDADRFVETGLRMKDGTIVECDLVVLATGFRNMQENIRRFLGDEIADKLGPVWGFDEDHQMRNMWRRTAQDGLWVMGGALIDARLHSRYLAIEIKASLEGLLPSREVMPIVPRGGRL